MDIDQRLKAYSELNQTTNIAKKMKFSIKDFFSNSSGNYEFGRIYCRNP